MEAIYKKSITEREEFYKEMAEPIVWTKFPETILDHSDEMYRRCWYTDGELSICYNALDRHVDEGRGDDIAYYEYSSNTGRD